MRYWRCAGLKESQPAISAVVRWQPAHRPSGPSSQTPMQGLRTGGRLELTWGSIYAESAQDDAGKDEGARVSPALPRSITEIAAASAQRPAA